MSRQHIVESKHQLEETILRRVELTTLNGLLNTCRPETKPNKTPFYCRVSITEPVQVIFQMLYFS